ncbi:MAG: hypothetical protein JW891_09325 [Candidatus Lokiarchaeota archaeon]|nr:hypothetical protein [Candidatus Lokiarchaeota archaeon]
MSEISDIKKKFLSNFQSKVLQGRKLLSSANHVWADKLLNDLYYDIEKTEWIDVQKKKQLIMIIVNTWHLYINSLIKRDESGVHYDRIKYLDAYNRFFTFLSRLDDFYHFKIFFTNLLKSFIEMEELSHSGISKFINSFCNKLYDREEYLELIELQTLLMYLRKSVLPTKLFLFGMEYLNKIVQKLVPDKRGLFIAVFLENVCIKYNLNTEGQEFVNEMNKILVNRLPNDLKNEFGKLGRVAINERTFPTVLQDLTDLVYYLNDIGEDLWILIIIRYIQSKIEIFQSFPEAINYIRQFIELSINRGRYKLAFEIYDFIEDLFILKSDLGYSNILVELWVEACKKFLEVKERTYLLQSLTKLGMNLKIPRTNAQILHFFHTCNYLWMFKSLFYSIEKQDFWRMMFYRALFEEGNVNLASKILPYLDANLKPLLTDLIALKEDSISLKEQLYSLDNGEDIFKEEQSLKKCIIRIGSDGSISYRIETINNSILDGNVSQEHWNDSMMLEIYLDLFSFNSTKKYQFSFNDLGSLFYLFLPKKVKQIISTIEQSANNASPQLYIILKKITIPFEIVQGNKHLAILVPISYKVGKSKIEGVSLESNTRSESPSDLKNVLIIESTNSIHPTKWSEKNQKKELLFPFLGGKNQLSHASAFFNSINKIGSITLISEDQASRERIITEISQGNHDIIHFIGNIFFSKASPQDSYILTQDKNIVKFKELFNEIKTKKKLPFLFFDAQIYDSDANLIENTRNQFGDILSEFDINLVMGIITRNYPTFDSNANQIIEDFYINLLGNESLGDAIINAIKSKYQENIIDYELGAKITLFTIFGSPWNKL